MSLQLADLPAEIGIKELSFDEAAEALVAQAVQGKIAPGRRAGYDVYKSALFPGQTFQVKASRVGLRPAEEKVLDGRLCQFVDTYKWTFSVGNSDYSADWYILFGERDGLVYPFLLSSDDWDRVSSPTGVGGRMLCITAQEHSACGRYVNVYKQNKHWTFAVRQWPDGLIAKLRAPRIQLRLAI